MKAFYLLFIASFLSFGCTLNSVQPGNGLELNMDFDIKSVDLRHGFAVFSRPVKTYTGSTDQASIDRGQKLYQKHCFQCHGEKGLGNGPLAKDLKIKPANLNNLSGNLSNTYLVVQINDGKGDMPQWQDILSAAETWDLTNYIRTLSTAKKK